MIESFHLFSGELKRASGLEEVERARALGGPLWVNLAECSDDEISSVLELFEFHPLTIEDCRHSSKQPKVDVLDDTVFMVVPSPKKTVPSREEFFMRELDVYLSEETVVTVHKEHLKAIQRMRDVLTKDEGRLLGQGADRVVHGLLDTIVDRYLSATRAIDHLAFEYRKKAERGTLDMTPAVVDLRHSCLALSQVVSEIRRNLLRARRLAPSLFRAESVVEFSDLDDHMRRVLSRVKLAMDTLESALTLQESSLRRRGMRARQWTLAGVAAIAAQLLTLSAFRVCSMGFGPWHESVPLLASLVAAAAASLVVARQRWLR